MVTGLGNKTKQIGITQPPKFIFTRFTYSDILVIARRFNTLLDNLARERSKLQRGPIIIATMSKNAIKSLDITELTSGFYSCVAHSPEAP